jgi:hypothetical protein
VRAGRWTWGPDEALQSPVNAMRQRLSVESAYRPVPYCTLAWHWSAHTSSRLESGWDHVDHGSTSCHTEQPNAWPVA